MAKFLNTVFYSLAAMAVGAALIMVWLNRFTVEISRSDESMRPAIGLYETKFDVDTHWLDALARGKGRDAIVAFIPPDESYVTYRATQVVAVAGDRVEIRASKPYVNGAVPKGISRGVWVKNFPEIVVPRDCVYVLNQYSSKMDSVRFGPLPLWRVGGRLVVRKQGKK